MSIWTGTPGKGDLGTIDNVEIKGPRPWVDVRARGALGNNSADDTSALQASIDAANAAGGGIVFIPEGVYRHTGLTLRDNVTLLGVGAKKSILRAISTTGDNIAFPSGGSTNAKIYGIKLDAVTTSSGRAISVFALNDVVREFDLDGYEIEGFTIGIRIDNALNVRIGQGRFIGRGKTFVGGIGIDVSGNVVTIGEAYISSYEIGTRAGITGTAVMNDLLFSRTLHESCTTGIKLSSAFVTLISPYFNANVQIIDAAGSSIYLLGDITLDNLSNRQLDALAQIINLGDSQKAQSFFGFRAGVYAPRKLYIMGNNLAFPADMTLSAGWGSTATVSAVTAKDSRGRFTVTSSGTGQSANPTVRISFKDGAFTSAPFVVIVRNGGDQPTVTQDWTTTTTSFVITWRGTPVAGQTFTFEYIVIG